MAESTTKGLLCAELSKEARTLQSAILLLLPRSMDQIWFFTKLLKRHQIYVLVKYFLGSPVLIIRKGLAFFFHLSPRPPMPLPPLPCALMDTSVTRIY